jgi:uncharacterized OB-fold protein
MNEALFPIINALNAPFWAAAAQDSLALPVCIVTGRAFWPPSPYSPFAQGGPVEWRPAEPVGTIRALAVYRRPFQQAFTPLLPYGVGLLELDAGPRLMAHAPASDDPATLKAGDRARLRFVRLLGDGPTVPTLFALT